MENSVFYFLSFFLLASTLGVVLTRTPIYSVLCLILSFINAAGLFVLLNAEFLAMVMVILYVGAVIILFLFLVMMLHAQKDERSYTIFYFLAGSGVATAIALALCATSCPHKKLYTLSLKALGDIFYTKNVALFLILGMILLVVMVGSVVLAKKSLPLLKRQENQIDRKNSCEIIKVSSHQGIKMPEQENYRLRQDE